MPQGMTSVEQEVINRLQNQIGQLAGNVVMIEIQRDLLIQERDALQTIVTALGGELPPSQVVRADANGSGVPEDRGTPGSGEAAGAARQARPPEPELYNGSDSVPANEAAGTASDSAQEADSSAGSG